MCYGICYCIGEGLRSVGAGVGFHGWGGDEGSIKGIVVVKGDGGVRG